MLQKHYTEKHQAEDKSTILRQEKPSGQGRHCVCFHVQKVQGHGFMYLGTNHWWSVGTAAAESEAGEQDAGRTTDS